MQPCRKDTDDLFAPPPTDLPVPEHPELPCLPPPTESGGRDKFGRFEHGNKLGKGNPFGKRQAELRMAMLDALTPERMKILGEQMYVYALGGDMAATSILLSYALGRPTSAPDPEKMGGLMTVEHMMRFVTVVIQAASDVIDDRARVEQLKARVLGMLSGQSDEVSSNGHQEHEAPSVVDQPESAPQPGPTRSRGWGTKSPADSAPPVVDPPTSDGLGFGEV
jgi:hypothetical protein